MLKDLSTMPTWIQELKLSACHKEAMRAMALAKAYHPEMKPELLAGGFPKYKVDNTTFGQDDFVMVNRGPGNLPLPFPTLWTCPCSSRLRCSQQADGSAKATASCSCS